MATHGAFGGGRESTIVPHESGNRMNREGVKRAVKM